MIDKVTLFAEVAVLRGKLEASQGEVAKLQAIVESLALRVAVQAELLGRAAEHRGESAGLAGRVKELEAALAPFAAVLQTGWDKGELPATAVYPVMMGDLRRAARVFAGTASKTE